jgi:thiol-disulfide isomerase/thioredoxin
MLKFFCFSWFLLISAALFSQKNTLPKLKTGSWTGNLKIAENVSLPFKFVISKSDKGLSYSVFNASEEIILTNPVFKQDTLTIEFPTFNSKLVLNPSKKKRLTGYWQNLNKGVNYTIPCTITEGYNHRFENMKLYVSNTYPPNDFSGKWESTFEPATADAYKAVGLFSQISTTISGTFLTETGDYRFLDGTVVQDSLFLSCFDGSHAFLFTGKLSNDKIDGKFYSGKHWQTDWIAKRNKLFELPHPDSLTHIVNSDPFRLSLKDLNGNDFVFPNENYTGKVTIIQIMGTWCPNCMDETRYFKELYATYHNQGLEIISVGYEVGNTFEEYAAKISTLKTRLNLDYTFLVGGSASKGLASEQFKMLNQIISFPTAIFIGKDGTIKKVHTGFNGPGTGSYYTDYVKETDVFIQELLKQ